MTVRGKWRIVEMPGYETDDPDMMGPAYILFDGNGGGELAFGCVTGALHGAANASAVEVTWDGNDEMDEALGDGSAELRLDRTLKGEIRFHRADDIAFTARRRPNSSTAC